MPKLDLPLSQDPYSMPFTSLGAEIFDNYYLEFAQSATSKAKYYQVGRQGLHLLFTGTAGDPCRGLFTTSSNRTFAANGLKVYEYTNQGQNRHLVGSLDAGAGTGPVYFRENGYQLFMVSGGYGWILDLTSGAFSRVTDEFFPGADDPSAGPTHALMVDRYFLANSQGTDRYYWSAPYYQPYAFDPLQPAIKNLWWGTYFGEKAGNADNIVAMIEMATNLVCVMGLKSTEFHRDTGNTSGQLFERIDVAALSIGCAAKHSLVKSGNAVYWLGRDEVGKLGVFTISTDFQPVRISKRGVETRIQTYDRVDDCVAYPFSIDGHDFIVWSFPSGSSVDNGPVTGCTWVYDMTTTKWYKYTRWDAATGSSHRWPAQFATYNWGMLLMGDATKDGLFWLDNEQFHDDRSDGSGTDDHYRQFTTPNNYYNGRMTRFLAEQLNLQQGTALRNGQGSAPVFALADSDDGGFTFGYESFESMGVTGEYAYRTRWTRRGMARNRVRRYRCTERIRVVVIGETIEFELMSR